MKTVSDVIAEARRKAGLNQSELARKLGVTPQSVQAWESGKSTPRPTMMKKISKELGMHAEVIIQAALSELPDDDPYGAERFSREWLNEDEPGTAAKDLSGVVAWDASSPVAPDEVEVPFLAEVELSAGSGRTSVESMPAQKLRFDRAMLRELGIQPDHVVCATVHGHSMSPVLPDGATVGIDTGSTLVREGKIYAIDHGGQLRVKNLQRLPAGGLRMRSYDREEYPDETYSEADIIQQEIKIIGRVFWSAVVW